jgi:hypothetical protein
MKLDVNVRPFTPDEWEAMVTSLSSEVIELHRKLGRATQRTKNETARADRHWRSYSAECDRTAQLTADLAETKKEITDLKVALHQAQFVALYQAQFCALSQAKWISGYSPVWDSSFFNLDAYKQTNQAEKDRKAAKAEIDSLCAEIDRLRAEIKDAKAQSSRNYDAYNRVCNQTDHMTGRINELQIHIRILKSCYWSFARAIGADSISPGTLRLIEDILKAARAVAVAQTHEWTAGALADALRGLRKAFDRIGRPNRAEPQSDPSLTAD